MNFPARKTGGLFTDGWIGLALFAGVFSCSNTVGNGVALSFNGTNQWVQIGPGLFPNVTNNFTMEFWVNPSGARTPTTEVNTGTPGTAQQYAIFPDQGQLAYGTSSDAGAGVSVGTNGISVIEHSSGYLPTLLVYTGSLSGWTHVAVVYSNAQPRLYVNGTMVRTGLASTYGVHPSANLGEAGYGYGYYAGVLAEVRIWSAVLDSATLQAWLGREVDLSHPAFDGLIGYWHLDEGYGSTAWDSSGLGNNGVLINGPTWVTPGAPLGQTIAITRPASNFLARSAALNGWVTPGGHDSTGWFEWGPSTYTGLTPPQSLGNGQAQVSFSQLIPGLTPDTTYHFRCVVTNVAGQYFGYDKQFKTAGPPRVQTAAPTNVAFTTATLTGTVNPNELPTSAWFEWGTNLAYGNTTPIQNLDPVLAQLAVTNAMGGLLAGTEHHYRLVATNTSGMAVGQDQSFRTLSFSNTFVGWGNAGNGSVTWADYDRNGELDLLLVTGSGTNAFTSLYQNSNGVFSAIPSYPWSPGLPNAAPGSVSWGDYNNDGNPDLLLSGNPSSFWFPSGTPVYPIFRNDNGWFTNVALDLPLLAEGAAAWGDYDNDGFLDFVMTGSTSYYGINLTNVFFHNNGDGTFTAVQAGLPAIYNSSVAWGDYNNDGHLDLLIAGDTGSGLLARVYQNDNGAFTDIGAGLPGVASGSVAWGDYDGDGWPDILLAGSTNGSATGAVCRVYHNNHDGTFTDIGANLPGVYQGTAVWGDYDNDGQLDILLTGVAPQFGTPAARIYRNDHGVFTDINAGLLDYTVGSGTWGDYDGDGKLDVAMIGATSDVFGNIRGGGATVYRNYLPTMTAPPSLPSAPPGLVASATNNSVTLSWIAASDPHTPAAGLTYNVRVGTSPGGVDVVSPDSDPVSGQRRLPQMGNAQECLHHWLTNLSVGTYHWSVQTVNQAFIGSTWAPEQTFAVTNGPPVVVTLPASNVLCCSALLNATVVPAGLSTQVWFEWGTTIDFGNITPPMSLSVGLRAQPVQQLVSNLPPLTVCYYRCVATNNAGLVRGTTQTFTTEIPAPLAATLAATNISFTSVNLLGNLLPGSLPADYYIEWGPTTAYGHLTPAAVLDPALGFDGVDDVFAVGWGKFPQVTNSFTIELWAAPTASRAETGESVGDTSGVGGQRYAVFPEEGAFSYGSQAHVGAGLSIGTNGISVMEHTDVYLPGVLVYTGVLSGWTHVALVYSNHVPLLYLNGNLTSTGLVSDRIVHPSAGLGGTTNWAAPATPFNYGQYQGALGDVRIWDVPLDSTTIQSWMTKAVTIDHPAYAHLQGYWPLDEGRGDMGWDRSVSANSGELLNGTYWTAGRGASEAVFGAVISGLSDGTTYHFRAVAINPGGTAYGSDQTFTTLLLPRVLDLAPQPGAAWLLQFSGIPGNPYVLETSTNLADWTALRNLFADPNGLFQFLDQTATNLPTRFYRLKVQ